MTRLRSNTISGLPGTSNYQGSIYASGTSAYLFTKTTAPGTDDFTIEFWINSDNAAGSNQEGVFAINGAAGGFQGGTSNQIRLAQGRYGGGGTNGGLEVDINGTSVGTGNGNDIIQEGTWHHVAVTRASGTVKIWVDGVEKASGSAAGNVTGTTFITGYYDGGYTYQGYMSNFRYRKGTAHYTTPFTPPTAVLERTSDTELLFAQSANNAGDGYSSAIHGGTTDIMQVNGNVTANTSAPTLTTSSSVGVVFDGDITFDSPNYMTLPKGTTTQSNRGRALVAGGYGGAYIDSIDYVNLTTSSNSLSFADLLGGALSMGGVSSSTRGIWLGGEVSSSPNAQATIQYVTIATTGKAVSFGSLTGTAQRTMGSVSSSTRGVIGGGAFPTAVNTMQYITHASAGNSTDFGDLTVARRDVAGAQSPTRGIFAGGSDPGNPKNELDYITIATAGNALDFGNLSTTRLWLGGFSSKTRAVYGGGGNPNGETPVNIIEYVTIASTGNATDFGDTFQNRSGVTGASTTIRGAFFGGALTFSPNYTYANTIDYVTIASTGNATDFGDITNDGRSMSAVSDCHGGLS